MKAYKNFGSFFTSLAKYHFHFNQWYIRVVPCL